MYRRRCSYTTFPFGGQISWLTTAKLLWSQRITGAHLFPARLRIISYIDFIHNLIVLFCSFHQESLSFGLKILARDRIAKECLKEVVVGVSNWFCLPELMRDFLHAQVKQWEIIHWSTSERKEVGSVLHDSRHRQIWNLETWGDLTPHLRAVTLIVKLSW